MRREFVPAKQQYRRRNKHAYSPVRINTISSPELAIWLEIMPFEPKSSSESKYFK